jgi:hypothetical protein
MPAYKCTNKECEKYQVEERRSSRSRYDREQKKWIDSGETCPYCGDDKCKLVLPESFSTNLKNFP